MSELDALKARGESINKRTAVATKEYNGLMKILYGLVHHRGLPEQVERRRNTPTDTMSHHNHGVTDSGEGSVDWVLAKLDKVEDICDAAIRSLDVYYEEEEPLSSDDERDEYGDHGQYGDYGDGRGPVDGDGGQREDEGEGEDEDEDVYEYRPQGSASNTRGRGGEGEGEGRDEEAEEEEDGGRGEGESDEEHEGGDEGAQ